MADDLVKLKDQVYKDPRPAETFDRYHARTRASEPGVVYEVTRMLTSLIGIGLYRTVAYGTEQVPRSGPLVIAPNHFSNFDHFFMGLGIRRKVHFMAKSQMFTHPMDKVYANGGTFPVRRGARDVEAFKTVDAILDRGGCIGMYCEGGRSRTGKLAETAKPGIGRIALESGATILPTAIHGSSHVRNLKKGQFPKVTVLFGTPLRYEKVEGGVTREQAQAASDAILDEIKALYEVMEQGGRIGAKAYAHRAARTA
jgi:1-acyl-sn-glycerol-3-phosphate acyltransferase